MSLWQFFKNWLDWQWPLYLIIFCIYFFICFFKYETIVMVFWSFRFRSKQCDIGSLLYWMRSFWNVSMCTVVCASPLAVMRYFMPKWFHKGFSVVMDWHFTHLTKKRRNRYGMKFIFFSSLLPNDFDLYYVCTSLTRNVETILVWQTSLV